MPHRPRAPVARRARSTAAQRRRACHAARPPRDEVARAGEPFISPINPSGSPAAALVDRAGHRTTSARRRCSLSSDEQQRGQRASTSRSAADRHAEPARRAPLRTHPCTSTASSRGSTSTTACCSWPRTSACRCSSASSSARSTPPTWTSTTWCASPGLRDQIDAGVENPGQDGRTPSETIALIRERVLGQGRRLTDCFEGQLRPALAEHDIRVVGVRELDDERRAELARHFQKAIFPALTPLAVAPGRPFPYISNLSLSLAVLVRDPINEQTVFARVKVPTEILPRFVTLKQRRGRAAAAGAARGRDRPPPRRAVPGHGDRRLRRLPRHARRRPRGLRRRRRPAAGGRGRAAPPALRRGRARRDRRPAAPSSCARRYRACSVCRTTRSTPSTACSTWARCGRS